MISKRTVLRITADEHDTKEQLLAIDIPRPEFPTRGLSKEEKDYATELVVGTIEDIEWAEKTPEEESEFQNMKAALQLFSKGLYEIWEVEGDEGENSELLYSSYDTALDTVEDESNDSAAPAGHGTDADEFKDLFALAHRKNEIEQQIIEVSARCEQQQELITQLERQLEESRDSLDSLNREGGQLISELQKIKPEIQERASAIAEAKAVIAKRLQELDQLESMFN